MIYKVKDSDGEVVARFVHSDHAAMFVAMLGEGSSIHVGGKRVWAEGEEKQSAAESYDEASETMRERSGR